MKLRTKYAESLDRSSPLAEYPRPQLKRDSYISLNGYWDYSSVAEGAEPCFDRKILVPFPPESALSEIEESPERDFDVYYRRTFSLPDGFLKSRLMLHFGAVDQISTLYINGCKVGTHEGGYLPFSFDITDFLSEGENEIILKVKDSLSHLYPYGKQRYNRGGMWYTPVSGIWQTVWLESLPENFISSLKTESDTKTAKITIIGGSGKMRLTLEDSGECFYSEDGVFTVTLENPEVWTPENPKLYSYIIESDTDRIESYFALRTVSIGEAGGRPRILLNGSPYLFNGLLDQGYFPDGIFTPASYKAYEDDILTAKALGFNMLRKHIKVEPAIFYYLCDRLGIAVFQDMVNNSDYSFFRDTALPTAGLKHIPDRHLHKNELSRKFFIKYSEDTINCLSHFPCVVYYTIFNEGWGQFNADEVYSKLKRLDETRIFDATSGWFTQRQSDVDSRHVYFKKLKAKDNYKKPLVISEFGGYSHRVDGHLFSEKNYGYKSFKAQADFADAVEKLYLYEVLPLVKIGVSALVYTQISDVEDETNGFITYDRRILKISPERMKKIAEALYIESEGSDKNPRKNRRNARKQK